MYGKKILPLLLQVHEQNKMATDFYDKNGFVKVVASSQSRDQFEDINWNDAAKKHLQRAWSTLGILKASENELFNYQLPIEKVMLR